MENPFVISGYVSPNFFCDRETETKLLIDSLKNGRNVTLISPRRMGKTGLIKNVFYQLQHDELKIPVFYMDIYSTQNLTDFTNLLANTVLGKLDTKRYGFINQIGARAYKNRVNKVKNQRLQSEDILYNAYLNNMASSGRAQNLSNYYQLNNEYSHHLIN